MKNLQSNVKLTVSWVNYSSTKSPDVLVYSYAQRQMSLKRKLG